MSTVLDREEYIEQAYFFRVFRERLATNMAAQEILERVAEEILSTTRLPMALQFLSTEMKHSGPLAASSSVAIDSPSRVVEKITTGRKGSLFERRESSWNT